MALLQSAHHSSSSPEISNFFSSTFSLSLTVKFLRFLLLLLKAGMCSVTKQLASTCQSSHSLSTVLNGVLARVLKSLDERSTRNLVTEHTPDLVRQGLVTGWTILWNYKFSSLQGIYTFLMDEQPGFRSPLLETPPVFNTSIQ